MHDGLGEQIVELSIVTALRGGCIDLEQRFDFGTVRPLVVGPSPVITPSRTMPRTYTAMSRPSLLEISRPPISSSAISKKADIVLFFLLPGFGISRRRQASGSRYISVWAIGIRGARRADFIGKM